MPVREVRIFHVFAPLNNPAPMQPVELLYNILGVAGEDGEIISVFNAANGGVVTDGYTRSGVIVISLHSEGENKLLSLPLSAMPAENYDPRGFADNFDEVTKTILDMTGYELDSVYGETTIKILVDSEGDIKDVEFQQHVTPPMPPVPDNCILYTVYAKPLKVVLQALRGQPLEASYIATVFVDGEPVLTYTYADDVKSILAYRKGDNFNVALESTNIGFIISRTIKESYEELHRRVEAEHMVLARIVVTPSMTKKYDRPRPVDPNEILQELVKRMLEGEKTSRIFL